MSRAGYSDELDVLELGRWRGRVTSSLRGRRGQQFLRDLIDALDAMPERVLVENDLVRDGDYCALGAVMAKKGLDVKAYDPFEHD